jgi:hypothetical protein
LRAFRIFLSAWKISAPQRRPSANDGAPTGITMNSCTSTRVSAWAPPFKMFIIGTGSVRACAPPTYRYSGSPWEVAAAWALARDTARMALAPSLDLLGVPSRSSIRRSTPAWSEASIPTISGAMTSVTLATAFFTPLPR